MKKKKQKLQKFLKKICKKTKLSSKQEFSPGLVPWRSSISPRCEWEGEWLVVFTYDDLHSVYFITWELLAHSIFSSKLLTAPPLRHLPPTVFLHWWGVTDRLQCKQTVTPTVKNQVRAAGF